MAETYLIGNAHLDPVWLWRWQEGFSEILSTFRSALDRMKEFPDFRFTSACAVYYEWVEKTDPAMFEEIRARVAEGRWCIAGGWFLQPDCNTPCGESFARHALISQRYFREKFGCTARTGYNVDSFGHNASLPQLLRKSGMENYVFMRPSPGENPSLPDVFIWESPDGSRVTAYRVPFQYNISLSNLSLLDKIREAAQLDGTDRMAFYGVGNHGGGPTIQLLDAIESMQLPDAHFSTPDEYFAALSTEHLPLVRSELQHHARGCYSACSFIKKGNRRCENNLLAAEAMCVLASRLAGMKYPHEKFTKAWKNLLFNQFHDVLGGCAIHSAYEDASYLYGELMSITEQAICRAAAVITRKIDTLRGEANTAEKTNKNWRLWDHRQLGTPFIVFNPHAWEITSTVYTTAKVGCVRTSDGAALPVQAIRGEHTNGQDDKYYTACNVTVPPYGYEVFRLFAEEGAAAPPAAALHVDYRTLENDRIRVEFDAESGEISSFTDKWTGKRCIAVPCSTVLLDETNCDTWAHGKTSLGQTVARFGEPEFTVTESGPVRVTLQITTRCGASILRRSYSLTPDSDTVTVRATLDFHEKHRALKLAFPAAQEVRAAIPFGSIVRPTGTGEEPCGAWLASGGLGFASDFACGYDTEDGMLRPTVLRSAIYADHFGQRDEFCEYMEQGVSSFTYILFPYSRSADAERRACTLNAPLIPYSDSFHEGTLPEKLSCMIADNPNVVVTAIKEAEDGAGTILRFYDAEGEDGRAVLTVFEHSIDVPLHHHEIKTYRITGEETDLTEREL